MSTYKKVLVAIDLTEEAPQVLNKAKSIAESQAAELLLVHVVEPVGYAYGGDIPMDLTGFSKWFFVPLPYLLYREPWLRE